MLASRQQRVGPQPHPAGAGAGRRVHGLLCLTGAAGDCPGRTARTTASAPRWTIWRPSWPNPARRRCSESASAPSSPSRPPAPPGHPPGRRLRAGPAGGPPGPVHRWVRRFDQEMAHGHGGRPRHQPLRTRPGAHRREAHAAPAARSPHQPAMRQRGQESHQRHRDHAPARPHSPLRRICCSPRWPEPSAASPTCDADVLLMGGAMKRPAFIRPAFEALAQTLPHIRCVVFPGLGHGGSSDVGPANRGGQPQRVAPVIRSFFAGHDLQSPARLLRSVGQRPLPGPKWPLTAIFAPPESRPNLVTRREK